MNKQKILKRVDDLFSWVVEVRRDIHMHPELAMEEFRTKKLICDYLEEFRIEYKNVAGTGVVGFIETPGAEKTVALRADMDALPMQDMKDVDYRSVFEGKMHSCGHDVHTAILLGTGKILSELKSELKCNVKFIFQPAEEELSGAKAMLKEDVILNPKPNAVFALHVDSKIESGKIGLKYDQYCASSDYINIRIEGKSSHGARPHEGIDAIFIAAQVITAIQSIISRNISANEAVVISLGKIRGGDKENIIAKDVYINGTLRALSAKTRNSALNKLKEIVETLPLAFGGKGVLQIIPAVCSLTNDNLMIDYVKKNVIELYGEEAVVYKENANMGVEDFAFYLNNFLGAIYSLGTKGLSKETAHPNHNNYFDIDEEAMKIGVAVQVMNVLDFC
jgi:amidohydrolase